MNDLDIKRHTLFHKRFISLLPSKYQSEDSNKLAIAYFSLASLELLGTLNDAFSNVELNSFIEYIYSHYIETAENAGFRGSLTYLNDEQSIELAATCFSLQCLLILKDDLSRLNKSKIMNFVKNCQVLNGGFTNILNSNESKDLRYCMIASTISKILLKSDNEISKILNLENLKKYILKLQTFDGGFSMCLGDESHGGMVFCAINALCLIQSAENLSTLIGISNYNKLIDFLVHREIDFNKFNKPEFENNEYADLDDIGGFNGRLNKYADTCYVFWILGTLKLFNLTKLVDSKLTIDFLINKTQNLNIGGFNKTTDPDDFPDPLHSFLGLCALSILNYPNLKPVNCELVIPQPSYEHWKSV
jgi:geranylgeranyl transferase type-1 subunit beta